MCGTHRAHLVCPNSSSASDIQTKHTRTPHSSVCMSSAWPPFFSSSYSFIYSRFRNLPLYQTSKDLSETGRTDLHYTTTYVRAKASTAHGNLSGYPRARNDAKRHRNGLRGESSSPPLHNLPPLPLPPLASQAVDAAQAWLAANVHPLKEPIGSLAAQMARRAHEEEQARKQREEAEAEKAHERQREREHAIEEQIRMNAERLHQARRRAMSDVTEVAANDVAVDMDDGALEQGVEDTQDGGEGIPRQMVEAFGEDVEWQGVRFRKVHLFHPEKGTFIVRVLLLVIPLTHIAGAK